MKRVLGLLVVVLGCVHGWADTLYVDGNNGTPIPPYNSWQRAATKIQTAIDAASDGDLILVTNGTYSATTLSMSRVSLDKQVTVQSVNGPEVTAIEGSLTLNIRCAWVGSNAVLSGFALTNGSTRTTGSSSEDQSGGGAWCETGGVVTNCIVVGCSANYHGGGVYGGSVWNSRVFGNRAEADGGGTAYSDVYFCEVYTNVAMDDGGGSLFYDRLAVGSEFHHNYADDHGGGTSGGTLSNCLIYCNQAEDDGGGGVGSILYGCTVYSNVAQNGGGVDSGELYGSFVFGNYAEEEGGGAS